MNTEIVPVARIRFARAARRGLAVAAVASALAAVVLPSFSASAAACPVSGGDYDYDGISCADEFDFYGTDPFNADTDYDGYSDSHELFVLGTSPVVPNSAGDSGIDSDFDGLSDVNEIYLHGTNPYNPDTDFDGLNDGIEWDYPSNPLYLDTDGDGYADGYEYRSGTDLLNPLSTPPPGVG